MECRTSSRVRPPFSSFLLLACRSEAHSLSRSGVHALDALLPRRSWSRRRRWDGKLHALDSVPRCVSLRERLFEDEATLTVRFAGATPLSSTSTSSTRACVVSFSLPCGGFLILVVLQSYIKSINPFGKGYDYIKPNQYALDRSLRSISNDPRRINWFRSQSAQVKPILRPYSPPGSTSTPTPAPFDKVFDDRKRRLSLHRKRQDDDDNGNEEDALDEAEEESEGFLPAVEPDDRAQVENSDVGSEEQPNDEAYLDQFDEIYDAEPIPNWTPVGPSAAAPLLAKPNAVRFSLSPFLLDAANHLPQITFFHIPLPEAYDTPVDIGKNYERLIVGSRNEKYGASKTNSNFFANGLMAQGELVDTETTAAAPVDEFWDGEFSQPTSGRPEVKVLAHGHCHLTEDCRRIKGVWVCFGGGGSYSGYGQAGYARRMRVFKLSDFGEKITTFELLDTKERIEEAVLTGEGALE